MQNQPLESQLFEWEGWDKGEVVATYTGCILKKRISYFAEGRRFRKIIVDLDQSVLIIFDNDDTQHLFHLELSTSLLQKDVNYDYSAWHGRRYSGPDAEYF